MLGIELVEKLRRRLEKDSTTKNLRFDNQRLVEALNTGQSNFIEWILEKRNEDDIHLIQVLLETKKLKESSRTEMFHSYSLPENYRDIENVFAKAKENDCIDWINLWEPKGRDTNELYLDEFNKPSFYYRDSFYILAKNTIKVFVDKFTIEELNLLYYREPKEIDVEGYINIHGKNSVNSDPELPDRALDKVIDIAVKNLNLNAENLQRLQPDIQKIVTKI